MKISTGDFIKRVQDNFYKRLEAKNGWGKNEIKQQHEQAVAEELIKYMDELEG